MTGEDWSTVNAQRAREIAKKKANGTWIDPNPAPAAAAPAPDDPEDDPPNPAKVPA